MRSVAREGLDGGRDAAPNYIRLPALTSIFSVELVLPALFGAVAVNAERDESTMVSLDDLLLASATPRSRQTRGDKEGDIAKWGPDGDDLPVDGCHRAGCIGFTPTPARPVATR